jgi:hypothetical protein
VAGRGGRRSTPQALDEAIARDDLVRVEEEDREGRPLLGSAERDQLVAVDDLERSQDPEVHDQPPRRQVATLATLAVEPPQG